MTLHDVIEVIVGLLAGGAAFLVATGVLVAVLVCVDELADKARQRARGGQSLRLERYRAEQDLHSIRREAIHDMLETARTHRTYDDVIEGTAVEIRP